MSFENVLKDMLDDYEFVLNHLCDLNSFDCFRMSELDRAYKLYGQLTAVERIGFNYKEYRVRANKLIFRLKLLIKLYRSEDNLSI